MVTRPRAHRPAKGDSRVAPEIAFHSSRKRLSNSISDQMHGQADIRPRHGRHSPSWPVVVLLSPLQGLVSLWHADPGLRAWLRHRTYPGLNTDGLPGLHYGVEHACRTRGARRLLKTDGLPGVPTMGDTLYAVRLSCNLPGLPTDVACWPRAACVAPTAPFAWRYWNGILVHGMYFYSTGMTPWPDDWSF